MALPLLFSWPTGKKQPDVAARVRGTVRIHRVIDRTSLHARRFPGAGRTSLVRPWDPDRPPWFCETAGVQETTRRRFLGTGIGVALLAAATGGVLAGRSRPGAAPVTPPGQQPPPQLVAALARENSLIASYTVAIAAAPDLAARLTPILADHQAHLATWQAEADRYPGRPPTPSGSASETTSTAPPGDALTVLRAAEAAAAAAYLNACLGFDGSTINRTDDASEPALAVLFGVVSACDTAHLELLA